MELVASEAAQQVRLADARVADDDNCRSRQDGGVSEGGGGHGGNPKPVGCDRTRFMWQKRVDAAGQLRAGQGRAGRVAIFGQGNQTVGSMERRANWDGLPSFV